MCINLKQGSWIIEHILFNTSFKLREPARAGQCNRKCLVHCKKSFSKPHFWVQLVCTNFWGFKTPVISFSKPQKKVSESPKGDVLKHHIQGYKKPIMVFQNPTFRVLLDNTGFSKPQNKVFQSPQSVVFKHHIQGYEKSIMVLGSFLIILMNTQNDGFPANNLTFWELGTFGKTLGYVIL